MIAVLSITTLQSQTIITYPQLIHTNNKTAQYPIKLLELSLQYSKIKYTLKQTDLKMLQGRALHQLKQNELIDVAWTMTSVKREKDLTPIRIPIYKGLIGSRLLLINKKDIDKFNNINSQQALSKFKAGQGHDWPDTEILAKNNIPIITSSNYQGLFKMLAFNRFDYFPRSLIEIWDEAKAHKSSNIIIEPNLLIYYPTATYFFVNKDNKRLADALKRGMEEIIRNGEFDKLFYTYHDEFIKKSDLRNRTVIKLDNPILPVKTPIKKSHLWLNPYAKPKK